jgi:3-hydroxymyristoyl/3-hydroxydecanoyl-(acyl carrier protein) dehydratase
MKFRLVDRIVAWQPRGTIRGAKAVSFEEYQLRRRLGDESCLPESLVLESLFQLGNWLVLLSSDFQTMGVVLRFEEVRFFDRLRPGRTLELEAVVRSWREDGIVFDGQGATEHGPLVAGRGCLALPVPLDEYCDAADLRVLFSEIYRPV